MRYIWDGSDFVPADEFYAKQPARPAGPMIMRDIPEYVSPVGSGIITSRSHRREDLKRSGCREVDPSEFTPHYHNRRFSERHNLPWSGKTDHPTHRSLKGSEPDVD